jgi:serine/threonine protein kinase
MLVGILVQRAAVAGEPPLGDLHWDPTPHSRSDRSRLWHGTDDRGRHYAGKAIDDHLSARAQARVLKQLNGYAGWPTFHYTIESPSHIDLVTDWVAGRNLAQPHRWNTGKAVRLTDRLLEHVAELHRRGKVHQDIKPSNVMIGLHEATSSLRLVDFEQAFDLGGVWNGQSGTPEYRAPEQAGGGPRFRSIDTFGAASFLLFLLNGEPPFTGARGLAAGDATLVKLHQERAAADRVGNLALRKIIRRALSPNPAERYQEADHLRQALAPFRFAAP